MFALSEDPTDRILAIVNRFLAIVFLIITTYILWTPFIGETLRVIRNATDKTNGYMYQSILAREHIRSGAIVIDKNSLKPIPTVNTLVIPKIGVDAQVVDGDSAEALNKGFWHRPNTSTPDKGGNTVIAGHRFLYTSGANTFYNLDQISKGDEIILYWKGTEYAYLVSDTRVVEPTDIQIEESSSDPVLTLYTCTPLWSSKQRLVVRAIPIVL